MAHQASENDACDYESPSGMRPSSMPPKNMKPTHEGNAGDKAAPAIQDHLDYGSSTATPNDVLLLLGAGQPYGAK